MPHIQYHLVGEICRASILLESRMPSVFIKAHASLLKTCYLHICCFCYFYIYIFIYFFVIFWSIVDLQWCVNFKCIAK